MRRIGFQAIKSLPILLIIVGAGIIAIAIAIAFLGVGGRLGWGPRKSLLTLVGIVVLTSGAFLALPIGKSFAEKLRTASSKAMLPVSTYLVAIWFGIIAGLGEVSILLFRKFFEGKILLMSRHFIWMIPVGEVCVFVIIAFVLRAIARRWPKLILPGKMVFVFAFLLSLSIMIRVYEVHLLASLILALGVAVQTARFVVAHLGIFYWMVRRTAPVLMILVGILWFGISVWLALPGWRALAFPTVASAGSPNVMIIVLDTVRAESMGLYGCLRPTTPNLERLAMKGVNFRQAYSTAPWTLPSHGSMFTGRWPHEVSSDWMSRLDAQYPTLAEVMGAHGYSTAGFVANTANCSWEHGLDRGFVHYEDHLVSPWLAFLSASVPNWIAKNYNLRRIIDYYEIVGRKSAEKVNQDFLSWVSNNNHRPFFVFLSYYDAHGPYLPPKPFDTIFGPNGPLRDPWLHQNVLMTKEDIQTEKNQYEGAIAYIDQQIGILYEELERRDLTKSTVIILVSDHGEQFGEHRFIAEVGDFHKQTLQYKHYLREHANSLYIQAIHVPLVILYPRSVPLEKIIDMPISLRDIAMTVLDLTNLGGTGQFPGVSLARFWEKAKWAEDSDKGMILSEINQGPPRFEPWAPSKKGDMKSLVNGRFHYILNGDGSEEIYDFMQDPLEAENLMSSAQGNQMLSELRGSLRAVLARSQGQGD